MLAKILERLKVVELGFDRKRDRERPVRFRAPNAARANAPASCGGHPLGRVAEDDREASA
jgi:hypothetical protein